MPLCFQTTQESLHFHSNPHALDSWPTFGCGNWHFGLCSHGHSCFGTRQDWGVKDITLQPIRLVLCERQMEYETLLQHTSRNNLIFIPWSQSSVITWQQLKQLDYDMVLSSKWRILSKSVDSWTLRGSQLFQKKGMLSEARGNKWIEQIICQCTLDQIQVKLATPIRAL